MTTFVRSAMQASAALISVLLLCDTASAQGTAPLPRLYVFTQVAKPGQAAAPDSAARQESAADLRQALRRKPKLLEVVDRSDKADLTIEVLSREVSAAGFTLTVRLRVVARDYARQFEGESRTSKDAASMVAEVIGRWVNESYNTPGADAINPDQDDETAGGVR
jgi:hypothetical protein